MERSMVEFNRSRGYLPDRYFYQLNGKSAEENYFRILMDRNASPQFSSLLEREIENQLEPIIEKLITKTVFDFA